MSPKGMSNTVAKRIKQKKLASLLMFVFLLVANCFTKTSLLHSAGVMICLVLLVLQIILMKCLHQDEMARLKTWSGVLLLLLAMDLYVIARICAEYFAFNETYITAPIFLILILLEARNLYRVCAG